MNFWEWLDNDEKLEDEATNPDGMKRFFLRQLEMNKHLGDCTGVPTGCSYCWITDKLIEFKNYQLGIK